MSRSKKRNVDEINDLKRIIKDKDATIKSLERQIRKLNQEIDPPSKKTKVKKEPENSEPVNKCPSCSKGKLKTVELGIRSFVTCDSCDHRLVIKRGS